MFAGRRELVRNLNWNLAAPARWLVIMVMLAATPFSTIAAPRIALLDFTADDNSWPSSQAAADFTIALQARLSGETEVVWVEREQLKLAESELRLSELGRMAGSDAIRRGKWVRADWLLLGRFTLDEDDERIARLELLDLNHAELLSEKTVILSGDGSITASPAKLDAIKAAVEEMLHEGRRWLNAGKFAAVGKSVSRIRGRLAFNKSVRTVDPIPKGLPVAG
jgi:hypothetical protein